MQNGTAHPGNLDTESAPESRLDCFNCAYDLRGLAADSVCPECGAAIERSLAFRLGSASFGYRHSITTGFRTCFYFVAIRFGLLLVFLGCLFVPHHPDLLAMLVIIVLLAVVYAVEWIVYWDLGTTDAAFFDRRAEARARRLKVTVHVQLISIPVLVIGVISLFLIPELKKIAWIALALACTTFFLAGQYRVYVVARQVQWLAKRGGSSPLERYAGIVAVAAPMLTVLAGSIFFSGLIAAMVMYLILLRRVSKLIERTAPPRALPTTESPA